MHDRPLLAGQPPIVLGGYGAVRFRRLPPHTCPSAELTSFRDKLTHVKKS